MISVGQTINGLRVIERAGATKRRQTLWVVETATGQKKTMRSDRLKEFRGIKKTDYARHGLSCSSEYVIWQGIIQRTTNSKTRFFRYYGGRGIAVCKSWRDSFVNFYADMGPRPGPGYSIDRINNDGNYEPGNCRWATALEQRHNQREPTGARHAR